MRRPFQIDAGGMAAAVAMEPCYMVAVRGVKAPAVQAAPADALQKIATWCGCSATYTVTLDAARMRELVGPAAE